MARSLEVSHTSVFFFSTQKPNRNRPPHVSSDCSVFTGSSFMNDDQSKCRLTDQKSTEEAALLVHVHSGGVRHRDKHAVPAAEGEQTPLVGGVQRELGSTGPAGGPTRLHQQDGNRV